MSLWSRAQQLPSDALKQVQGLYGDQFPIEVRHCLAVWIESRISHWNDIGPDNPSIGEYAVTFISQLIQEIENKIASLAPSEFHIRYRLEKAADILKKHHLPVDPVSFVNLVKHCLETERNLVQQYENVLGGMGSSQIVKPPEACLEIIEQLEHLRRCTLETKDRVRQLEQELESFTIQYHECTKVNAQLSHLESQPDVSHNLEFKRNLEHRKTSGQQMLTQKLNSMVNQRVQIQTKHQETIEALKLLQTRILDDELIKWKRGQRLSGNGKVFVAGKIEQIQDWCESLAEIIWTNRNQIKECERLQRTCALEPVGGMDLFPILDQEITRLLSSLVTSTFVIEKNPPQVIKTNTRFSATVRLLVGGKLDLFMNPPQVKVSIISEAQATALLQSDSSGILKNESAGEIINNTGTMEYNQANHQLSVNFRNLCLRKVKRAEKKGTESVMDEKFALLFQSNFSIGGGELVFQVWTLSLPCVAIVHGNQEPQAWATVSWDNAFTEEGRIPFAVPDKVPWPQVADMLDTKFKSLTGRGLTEDNLLFLAQKAFRNPQLTDPSKMMLTWSQFCKEPLPDRPFTFWEWFFAVMKVTREHLKELWVEGWIMGFVCRREAENLLLNSRSGTFLLRFSDSELGGITIAWMFEDVSKSMGDQRKVYMLQPFTAKDFAIKALADTVAGDLNYLWYLYPNTPKEQAFAKYLSPVTEQPNQPNGYVKPKIAIVVPGFSGHGSQDSYPNTPNYELSSEPGNPSSVTSLDGNNTVPDFDLDTFEEYEPAQQQFNMEILSAFLKTSLS